MFSETPSKVKPAELSVEDAVHKRIQATVEQVRAKPDVVCHQTSIGEEESSVPPFKRSPCSE